MKSSASSGGAEISAAPPLVLLLGPTASGKTDASLAIAEALGAEIVAADSRQLYRGLDAGTGKPDAAARRRVPHHMLDLLDAREVANAARYGRLARLAVAEIRSRGKRVLVVGGSGLYVRALLEGLFDGPGRDDAFRAALSERAARDGWPALHAEVAACDPESGERIHPNDAVRITRALEIARGTGLPPSVARRRLADPPLEIPRRAFAIAWERAELDRRIARRWEAMLAAGLTAEVASLLAAGVPPDAPALQAPGYREIARHLAGGLSAAEASADAIRETRRYAKRQMTWLRKVADLEWTPGAEDSARVAAAVLARLGIDP